MASAVVFTLLLTNGLPSLVPLLTLMVVVCHYGMLTMTTIHPSPISLLSADGLPLMLSSMLVM